MTYNITGLAVIEGLATSLDTLCSQAYGAKEYKKVGLYTQRCGLMILSCLLPIIGLWFVSEYWLSFFIPQHELLKDVQTFLRIISFGVPALTIFEVGKRFVQSQGLYNVSTYALTFIFPINLVLIYVLTLNYGFVGAPIAIAISHWLMAVSLAGYCIFIKNETLKCWSPVFPSVVYQQDGGFAKLWKAINVLLVGTEYFEEEQQQQQEEQSASSYTSLSQENLLPGGYGSIAAQQNVLNSNGLKKKLPILQNWKPMLEMAWPGLIMIESEYLSFEILTIFSTYLGDETEIAIQTVIASVGTLIYQDIFAMGCVISTRIAQFVGSYYHELKNTKDSDSTETTLTDITPTQSLAKRNAITCIKACYIIGVVMGFVNWFILYKFSSFLARLFTQDELVITTSSMIMPILAFNQYPDAFNVINASILRGQGRQRIGGILNMLAYYVVGLPMSYFFAFNLGLGIKGLWYGGTVGITLVASAEMFYVIKSDWDDVLNSFLARLDEENQS